MSFLFKRHESFCLIRVPLFLPRDTSSVSEVLLGFFEPLRQTFTVYAMTHAHWFTRGSHSGAGRQGCLIHTHESWKKDAHAHTHIHTLVYSKWWLCCSRAGVMVVSRKNAGFSKNQAKAKEPELNHNDPHDSKSHI